MITIKDKLNKDLLKEIVTIVYSFYGLEVNKDNMSRTTTLFTKARHMCWYILHYNFSISNATIANIFNVKKRGVIKAMSNVCFSISTFDEVKDDYDVLVSKIGKELHSPFPKKTTHNINKKISQ